MPDFMHANTLFEDNRFSVLYEYSFNVFILLSVVKKLGEFTDLLCYTGTK